MIAATFWLVALLTATKTVRDISVPAPFEWVGELAAGILSMIVAYVSAYALQTAIGPDTPWATYTFVAGIAPPYTGDLT